MGILQEMLESALREYYKSDLFVKGLIRRKFASTGFELSDKQIAYVVRRLRHAQGEDTKIRINPRHLGNAETVPKQGFKETISLHLSEDDIEGTVGAFNSQLPQMMDAISDEVSSRLLRRLKREGSPFLKENDRDRLTFEARLAKTWRRAFYLIELLLAVALQAGADFSREGHPSTSPVCGEVLHVLTRLHARACQVSAEIIALLKAGFADGAHARWRTLHEIAVVSTFIAKHGAETARRYLAHGAVESNKAATQYQRHCSAIGYGPLDPKEITEIQRRYAAALQRFGRDFRGSYGWAASALRKSKPTFSDIEQDVKLDSLSPFYRLASHNVHANPKGLSVKLGLGPDVGKVLLAGPSNTGLADPAQGAALSLLQTTSALLGTRPNLDAIVVMKMLVKLEAEIAKVSVEIQRRIESKGSRTVVA